MRPQPQTLRVTAGRANAERLQQLGYLLVCYKTLANSAGGPESIRAS